MKITYTSVTGEVFEVECPDDIGEVIIESRREEENCERRHRYHIAYSMDELEYEGPEYASKEDIEADYLDRLDEKAFETIISCLTETMKRRMRMYYEGMTEREIAAAETVSQPMIHKSLVNARKILQKQVIKNRGFSPYNGRH